MVDGKDGNELILLSLNTFHPLKLVVDVARFKRKTEFKIGYSGLCSEASDNDKHLLP